MSAYSELRDRLRPHGMVAAGCYRCPFLGECGGIEPEQALLDCFHLLCCKDADGCDEVCPHNKHFVRDMEEVGGLRFDDVPVLHQSALVLPRYVPMINHPYGRLNVLDWPIVAVDPYSLFRTKTGRYAAIVEDAESLRKLFGLRHDTQIVLRGTAKDTPLERYWHYHVVDNPAQQLARLGIHCAIGPNFSHFLDVPRTHSLFNRKRQLQCLSQLSSAGIATIPHLSASAPADWDFWRKYLLLNDEVRVIAVEVQTGNRQHAEGLKVFDRIATLQSQIARPLRPIAIGGAQFAGELSSRFDDFTILDSTPFMKAVKRQLVDVAGNRLRWETDQRLQKTGIDDILAKNLHEYDAWIDRCSRSSKKRVARVRNVSAGSQVQ